MSDIDGKSASHTSPDQGQHAPHDGQMRVTDRVFTLFGSAVNRSPHRGKDCTLDELHNKVKSGEWWDKVAPVRELAPYKDEKDETGKKKSPRAKEYSKLKEDTLPYAVVSGTWNLNHRHADGSSHGNEPCKTNGIKTPSGIRLLDLDGLSEKQQKAIKATLDAGIVPWAAACWKSTGGDGLHLFAALDPPPTCQDESHAAFAALIADLREKIPYAKAVSDPSSKNLMRASFVSADSDARIYPDASPLRWQDVENSGADQQNQQGNKTGNKGNKTGKAKNRPQSKDAPPELVQKALAALAAGRAGEDDNHMLGVMGNMRAYGFTFAEFDQWGEDAGCTCEREPRWNSPPQGTQSDQPGWAIVNLARKHYGMPKKARTSPDQSSNPTDELVDDSGANLPARWFNVGLWVADQVLYPDYVYESKSAAWWAWRDGYRWEMLLTYSHEIGDRLHKQQYALAHQLRLGGADATAALVASKEWQEQVRGTSSPFMAGLRQQLTRNLRLPPDHIVAVANGVLNMRDDALDPHDPRGPYLITAVANGAYLPEYLDHLRNAIDTRLAPAIPDEARRAYLYKCLAIMLGGQGGSNLRGSLLYLLGTSGGGKGNTARVVRDAAGGYAATGNADALFAKGDINETLARLLEMNPRVVMFHESERLPMAKILSMTGRDSMAARGPHKATIERSLSAGVIVTAVNSPHGRMDGGAKRRLASVKFEGKARVSRTSATDETTQEQRDALITVALADAICMWQNPARWEPLPDDDYDTWDAVAAADPIEAAIDALGDDDVGKTIADVLAQLQEDAETGDPAVKKLTVRAFSTRLGQRDDWKSCRHREGDKKCARLYRPDGCPCDRQSSFE